MRLGRGVPARVAGRRRRRPPRVHPQRAAGVRRAWVDRVRHVGDEDDQRKLGQQFDGLARAGAAGEGQAAVRPDPDALEERDGRRQVARGQPVLGRRQREQLPAGRARPLGGRVAVLRLVGGGGAGAAEGVVPPGVVADDRRQDAAVAGQQRVPGGEVGLPADLDGVGHVEPLPRLQGVVEQDVRARLAGDVLQPDPRSARDDLVRVVAPRDGLRPGERARLHAGRRVRRAAGGQVGHRVGDPAALGPRVRAGQGDRVGLVLVRLRWPWRGWVRRFPARRARPRPLARRRGGDAGRAGCAPCRRAAAGERGSRRRA